MVLIALIHFCQHFRTIVIAHVLIQEREILLNTEWANNSYINQYSPLLLKFRTNLLFDQKEEIKTELSDFIDLLPNKNLLPENERKIIDCFECMSKLLGFL